MAVLHRHALSAMRRTMLQSAQKLRMRSNPVSVLPGWQTRVASSDGRFQINDRSQMMWRFHSTARASHEEEMDKDEKETRRFLSEEAGYDAVIVDGIVRALQSPHSGVPKGAMSGMVCALAGRLEVGEDAGLEALAKSVEMDLKERTGKTKVSFLVRVPHAKGLEFTVQGFEGESLRDVATHGRGKGADLLREFIECACSGVMACSTCHVIVDPAWFEKVGRPTEEEVDMIDLAFDPQETSRLGCQLVLSTEIEGCVVTIPESANNLFDHIPFE